jgi:hypothetical protein
VAVGFFTIFPALAVAFSLSARFEPEEIALDGRTQFVVETVGLGRAKILEISSVEGITLQRLGSAHRVQSDGTVASTLTYLAVPQKTGLHTLVGATALIGDDSVPLPTAHLTVRAPTEAALRNGQLPPVVQRLHLHVDGLPKQLYVGQIVPIEIALSVPNGIRVRVSEGMPQKIGESFRLGRSSDLPLEQMVELRDPSSGEARWRTSISAIAPGELSLAFALGLEVAEELPLLVPGSAVRNWATLFTAESWAPVSLSSVLHGVSAIPLPSAGRPKNFSGAIGKFFLPEPAKVRCEGGIVEVQLTVEGEGNFGTLVPPPLSLDQGRVLRQTRKIFQPGDSLGLGGSVTFSYFLADRQADDGTATFSFPYFNPESGSYECISTPLWGGPARPKKLETSEIVPGYLRQSQSSNLQIQCK